MSTSVLRAQAQEKGLDLDYRWATYVPVTIESDPARLRQLLINLVGNAIKFTERGYVSITVRLNEAGEQLAISVEDTGVGISTENQQTIFDPFVQADTSVTRRFGGTGLGLAISRRLARALGGDLTVSSQLGRGSCFTALLATGPLAGVQLHPSVNTDVLMPREEVTTADSGETTPILAGAKILVVEDGPVNRKLVQIILSEAGAQVSLAENGQVGWELGRADSYDAILMDMQMPVMDGYTAAGKLREAGVTIPRGEVRSPDDPP